MIFQVKRWLRCQELVVVADHSFACLELLSSASKTASVSMISRLSLDAAVYESVASRPPATNFNFSDILLLCKAIYN